MAKPATITEYGPTMLPPAAAAGASAANATAGTRTAAAARISERTPALLCTWCLVMRMCLAVVLVVLGPFHGAGDVEHRQHHEDEGLQERHEDLEGIQEPDG